MKICTVIIDGYFQKVFSDITVMFTKVRVCDGPQNVFIEEMNIYSSLSEQVAVFKMFT